MMSYLEPNRSGFTSCEQVLTNKNGVSLLHSLQRQKKQHISIKDHVEVPTYQNSQNFYQGSHLSKSIKVDWEYLRRSFLAIIRSQNNIIILLKRNSLLALIHDLHLSANCIEHYLQIKINYFMLFNRKGAKEIVQQQM